MKKSWADKQGRKGYHRRGGRVMGEWLWKRCERTPFVKLDGRGVYYGHFTRFLEGREYEEAIVLFFAAYPHKAMKVIMDSGLNPEEFRQKAVN